MIRKFRNRLQSLGRYYKGRWWCLIFHAPVLRSLGGYGGRDHWGCRQKAYHGMWCVKCDNRWDQASRGERTTGAHVWHRREHEKPSLRRNHVEPSQPWPRQ